LSRCVVFADDVPPDVPARRRSRRTVRRLYRVPSSSGLHKNVESVASFGGT